MGYLVVVYVYRWISEVSGAWTLPKAPVDHDILLAKRFPAFLASA
jgi:hypothetical protein